MTDPQDDATPAEPGDEDHESRLHRLERTVHDHLVAAEVAMEEAAGYGEVTAAVKGAEAAVEPDTELGDAEEDSTPRR
ncbi:MAG: hypothetical protein JOY68_07905 [Candidatus Dormibacteraeota bacterium]|nr:hypothetical protein [Candidatus Dormibacteraeota bacterium]